MLFRFLEFISMSWTATSSEVKSRWNAKTYDTFTVYVKKGTREQLQAWCAENGETVGGLTKKLLEERTGVKLT